MEKKVIIAPDNGITGYYPNHLIDDRAWSMGNNVQFGVGFVKKANGWKPFLQDFTTWTPLTTFANNAYCVPAFATITMAIKHIGEAYYYVVTWTAHGLTAGNAVRFFTTGTLLDGLFAGRAYYVISDDMTANTFRFAKAPGGTAVGQKDATQNGNHTASKNDHVYKATNTGNTGVDEPTWPVSSGGTVVDNEITWQEVGFCRLTGTLQAIDNYYRRDESDWLIFITTKKVYYYDPDQCFFIDITGETDLNGDDAHVAYTENAADCLIFTNGKDPVKYWGGPPMTVIADLPGLTDCEPGPEGDQVTSVRAKCLAYWNNFLILGDTTENSFRKPQRIRWSKLGDITVWKNDAEGNGEAGCADISEGVDWVQAIRPLGSYLVVYKERSIQVLTYVGGDQIWDKRPAIIGTGLLAPRALCDLGDEHIFVGPDNFYSFDGIEPKIAGDAVAKEFFRLMEPAKAGMTNSFFIEETPEAWFGFVSIDSPDGFPDRAMTYNTDSKAWSWRDAPLLAYGYYFRSDESSIDSMEFTIDSWDEQIDSSSPLENFPINLAGDANGVIYVLKDNSLNDKNIVSYLQSKLFDFDEPVRIKRLLRIQLMISREGPYYLPIYIGTADNVDEDVVLHGPYNMNLDKTYPPWIDVDISSRYFYIGLGTILAEEPFTLTGYILYYELRGEV